jgi:hypothetical protein
MATGIGRLSEPFAKRLIKRDAFRNFYFNGKPMGYEFKVASNGYRGTYLSCIEHISFKLDSVEIPVEDIVFCINGNRFLVHQLSEIFTEYWFTLDYATIQVNKRGGLPAGEYTLEYRIVTRIPFSGYFGKYESADTTVQCALYLNNEEKSHE